MFKCLRWELASSSSCFFPPLIECVNSCTDERTSWGLCSGGQGSCWGRADDKEGRGLPAVQGWSHGGHAAGETSFGQSCIQNDTFFFCIAPYGYVSRGFKMHSPISVHKMLNLLKAFFFFFCQLAFHTFYFYTNFFSMVSSDLFASDFEIASEKNLLSTDNKK